MENKILKTEGFLRLSIFVLAVTGACLVGLDTQTKEVFLSIKRKATDRDLKALVVVVIVDAITAGYSFIQLSKSVIFAWFKENPGRYNPSLSWVCFLLDQMVAYICFGANAAGTQASLLAVTGATRFEWMKLCNIYTRFCDQIGGGLFCGTMASLLMAIVTSISAFRLFRLYSPHQFLLPKGGVR
ncbi:CASP-like protein 2C1 [Tasmannia lanceolata]|uniref:CASP-like protein 2C1 n=1 Tax=Tasmannia lanceolata TaxID=3420 RepID=UPI0040636CAF